MIIYQKLLTDSSRTYYASVVFAATCLIDTSRNCRLFYSVTSHLNVFIGQTVHSTFFQTFQRFLQLGKRLNETVEVGFKPSQISFSILPKSIVPKFPLFFFCGKNHLTSLVRKSCPSLPRPGYPRWPSWPWWSPAGPAPWRTLPEPSH